MGNRHLFGKIFCMMWRQCCKLEWIVLTLHRNLWGHWLCLSAQVAYKTYWGCPWLRSRENDAKLPRNRPWGVLSGYHICRCAILLHKLRRSERQRWSSICCCVYFAGLRFGSIGLKHYLCTRYLRELNIKKQKKRKYSHVKSLSNHRQKGDDR